MRYVRRVDLFTIIVITCFGLVHVYWLGILIFSKARLIFNYVNNIKYINNFAALGLNLRVNAATFNLSLPLYLLQLNIENELNDVALPFDGDLTSMRKLKYIQKG